MHKATALKSRWVPVTPPDGQGGITAAPEVVLKRESQILGDFWRSLPWAQEAWMPEERAPFPRVSPERIRAVAKTFPATTAGTIDGFHVMHFAMLTDETLNVLSISFAAVETLGLWPPPCVHCCPDPREAQRGATGPSASLQQLSGCGRGSGGKTARSGAADGQDHTGLSPLGQALSCLSGGSKSRRRQRWTRALWSWGAS